MEWTEIGKGLQLPEHEQTVYITLSYDPDVCSSSQGTVIEAIFKKHETKLGFFYNKDRDEVLELRHVSHWMPRIVPEPPK